MNRSSLHFILAAIVAVALPLFMRSGTLASEVLIYAMAASACNLLLGYTGLLSFGQGIFFGLGSYVVGLTLLHTPLPLGLAILFSIVIGALVATGVGWLSIRRQGVYFVMLTLAFSQFFYFLAYTFKDITGGDNGLLNIPRPDVGPLVLRSSWAYYAFIAIIFLLIFATLQRVASSTFGRTLLAIRDNEERARAIGFPVRTFKITAFAISGAVTGLAGALHALLIGVAPLSNIDYHMSESILIMTIIGGTGNLFASVLGAGFYVIVSDLLSTIWPRWLLLLGGLLVVVALFMQQGLWGLLERIILALRPASRTAAGKEPGRSPL
ncbi:branched-chain amino acid ABC transporter permease [Microvirga aerilata]|uniref:Branched-chain amino acid ABC transporter permease n=1 Tax=Microvirga aerilata TaxID=670292 RepID=A0A937D1S1_9HYPH|nr:branched-chain amino acid ABC transporter permease [Microvirga aerilata]MBL0407341.1 branched-chain amino acid ABC transporter permease [Microvirga aerilata]